MTTLEEKVNCMFMLSEKNQTDILFKMFEKIICPEPPNIGGL